MEELMSNYTFGALPSPKDDRDWNIQQLIAKVGKQEIFDYPEEFCLEIPPIKDQKDTSSCVGHSLANYKEIKEKQQNGIYSEFSPFFIYANREKTDYQGTGMYPNQAIQNLQKYGALKQSDFPYFGEYLIVKDKLDKDKDNLLKKAEPYKISAYARLTTVEDIKHALINIGAVTIMYDLKSSFFKTGKDGIVPPREGKSHGYHQMLCVGYKKINGIEHLIILNSWGKDWADNGICYINESTYYFQEAWSLTDNIINGKDITIEEVDDMEIKLQIGIKNMLVDGVVKEMDVAPFIQDGRTFVPIRFIAEALGCNIRWEDETKTITIIK